MKLSTAVLPILTLIALSTTSLSAQVDDPGSWLGQSIADAAVNGCWWQPRPCNRPIPTAEQIVRCVGLTNEDIALRQTEEWQAALDALGLDNNDLTPPGVFGPRMGEAAAAANGLGENPYIAGENPCGVYWDTIDHSFVTDVNGEIMRCGDITAQPIVQCPEL